jgi:hypothetical protein
VTMPESRSTGESWRKESRCDESEEFILKWLRLGSTDSTADLSNLRRMHKALNASFRE